MTVAELTARLSGPEWTNWLGFYKYEAKERERAARRAKARGKRKG